MIERYIRAGKVYEVQVTDVPSNGCIRGAVIKREVEPTADELEQMESAKWVMDQLRRNHELWASD